MTHGLITFLHLTFYRWVVLPLLIVLSHAAAPFNWKIRAGLELRKKRNGRRPWLDTPPDLQPVWFHCSSGELEYAKPVIQLLKQRQPHQKILLTYFSPSVERAARNFSPVDFALPVPWDHPWALREFIAYHKPKALALARTDTWPELVYQCEQHEIPAVLFSATLSSSKSKFLNPFSRAYHRWIFDHLEAILCVSDDDRANFKAMGVSIPCLTTGDTRYDQVLYRLKNPKPLRENLKPRSGEAVFIAGSTWPEDEDRLIPALAQLGRYSVRAIVAPHEPTPSHLAELEMKLKTAGCSSVRYTRAEHWAPGQVLIVDTVGILADLYQWGHIAFVGNSFQRHAVHSVMEPLAAGCVTLFGPYHHNNREALAFQKIQAAPGVPCAQTITGPKDFEERILSLQNTPGFSELKETIRTEVKKRTGASLRVLEFLETQIRSGNPASSPTLH
ncbi:MAG TPA: glycosyltransferase N-terminal domain-containing protein [Bdellovibrionales bacterium]|nr:glycosyltransferase N-terminal domain-containing protein [Bdellovibrionales bacterium]